MKLPDLRNFKLNDKTVLLRVNYDVPLKEQESERAGEREWAVADDSRIKESLPTINYLLEQKCKIILLSHLGRPEGKTVQEYSLRPCVEVLNKKLKIKNKIHKLKIKDFDAFQLMKNIILLENLRFYSEEEANDPEFAKQLASLGDFYINDAFACSHREHASIVGLPEQFKYKSKNTVAAGLDLLEELDNLSGLMEKPKKPVVFVFGGVKKDKLENLPGILKWVDKVLIGGKFPQLIDKETDKQSLILSNKDKVIVATLNEAGSDITKESIEKFKSEINKAGTIILAGPMGQYEEEASQTGTKEIIKTIVESSAFKVAGGGDTESAISKFGYDRKFDFISSGGGAMLEYLANGDLPGLKALRD